MSDLNHVGLTVRDIERSYAFYSQVVGMRVWDQDAELGTKRALESYSETSSKGPELIGIRSDAFDKLTNAQGDLIQLGLWYDNEWGYSCRLADVTKMVLAKMPAAV